jgi:hypothetical protein
LVRLAARSTWIERRGVAVAASAAGATGTCTTAAGFVAIAADTMTEESPTGAITGHTGILGITTRETTGTAAAHVTAFGLTAAQVEQTLDFNAARGQKCGGAGTGKTDANAFGDADSLKRKHADADFPALAAVRRIDLVVADVGELLIAGQRDDRAQIGVDHQILRRFERRLGIAKPGWIDAV